MEEEKLSKSIEIKNLSYQERARLVDFFAWLIAQDKKQNPALYQPSAKRNG